MASWTCGNKINDNAFKVKFEFNNNYFQQRTFYKYKSNPALLSLFASEPPIDLHGFYAGKHLEML